jgi:hypothetical protein
MWPLKAQLRRSTAVLLQDPVMKSLITSHHIINISEKFIEPREKDALNLLKESIE